MRLYNFQNCSRNQPTRTNEIIQNRFRTDGMENILPTFYVRKKKSVKLKISHFFFEASQEFHVSIDIVFLVHFSFPVTQVRQIYRHLDFLEFVYKRLTKLLKLFNLMRFPSVVRLSFEGYR